MMNQLNLKQKEFYKIISKILWEKWDPIGINDGDNEFDDEYDSYVPHIYRLAIEGHDAIRIASSLSSTIEQNIGLSASKEHDLKVGELIVNAKCEIFGLISHFGEVSESLHSLTWKIGNEIGTFQTEDDIISSAYSPKNNLVLLLTQSDNAEFSNRLLGLESDGEIRFDVKEPKEYWFYYLSSHVNCETAVVCISKGNALDWYFSINPESGELRSLNRSY